MLKKIFHQRTITGIRNFLKRNNTFVIALVMFYENITTNITKVYRVLICVLYYAINNYVSIDYLCCQYKPISEISSDNFFGNKTYTKFLGIGIPEVLMNLI